MRTVTAAVFVSLDGVMQAPGGPEEDPTARFDYGGWVWPWFDEKGGELMDRAMGERYDLLLGRKTYEIFAAYWPQRDDDIARKFNACTKYVAAGADEPLSWVRSVRLEGDVADAVAGLKQEDGPPLLIQGSSEVVHALLARGLIDRLTLLTFPIVLGRGKRFFDEAAQPRAFSLIDSTRTASGVVVSEYRLGGEVPTGTFEDGPPSPAELERRARMSREG
ncbi:dihydrofolate reductase family protein [Brevundimonas sp. Root1279]|uniref:dihydrofolate reductase family protein n=1 Tax=Brevundimonas sp. Root1279 TaxID=1736443 RepID=UPI0006FC2609|nr:dihydrofolate reductase family protein [Brevundimonas sp. Root1279]KQW83824.1 hypothetical protein ASC65_04060 [Brevundimonas sp. Root1279]